MQPAQQQGRRIPPFIFERALLIRISLVSFFLPEITQQIHSLRASGVIFSQIAIALGVVASAFLKSEGILCGIRVGLSFLVINLFYQFNLITTSISFLNDIRFVLQ
jgi:hypothetical protein